MQFAFRPLTPKDALAIAAWHYDGIYAFYDMDQDPEDLAELLDPTSWPERYYAAVDECGDLVGFSSFIQEGATVTLGLGLRPDLTGQGLGLGFVEAGLAFARAQYHPQAFCLSVATFNQRAIRVYEKAGFHPEDTYVQRTNGGEFEFLRMSCRTQEEL